HDDPRTAHAQGRGLLRRRRGQRRAGRVRLQGRQPPRRDLRQLPHRPGGGSTMSRPTPRKTSLGRLSPVDPAPQATASTPAETTAPATTTPPPAPVEPAPSPEPVGERRKYR